VVQTAVVLMLGAHGCPTVRKDVEAERLVEILV
jgi:hypothetical protein